MTKMIYKLYSDKYVAAIIQGTFELGQYLLKVPKERLETLRIEPLRTIQYPFKMIEFKVEDRSTFIPVLDNSIHDIRNMIGQIGGRICATYTITEDFHGDPKFPGKDYMGALDHEHEPEDEDGE
jgi:hypothetical protein